MTAARSTRWIRAARLFGRIEQSLVPAVQWLGRLDMQQIHEDMRYLNLSSRLRATADEIRRFSDHYTMSYLWVLEAHEVLRMLDKRMRENIGMVTPDVRRLMQETEQVFGQVRIPLKKNEATNKQRDVDPHIFLPVLNRELGIGWQISQDNHITRRELSDAFLVLMESVLQSIKKVESEVISDGNVPHFPETREEVRTAFQQAIKYVADPFAGNTALKGVTVNLSRSGMCLITFDQLTEGQRIKIEKGLNVSNPSTVRWVKKLDKDIFKVGVQTATAHL